VEERSGNLRNTTYLACGLKNCVVLTSGGKTKKSQKYHLFRLWIDKLRIVDEWRKDQGISEIPLISPLD
jgi:hypothetical protein